MRKRNYIFIVLAAGLLSGAGCTKKLKANYHLSRADKDFAAGQYEKAEIEYRKVLQVSPLNPRAISHLGTIYYEEGRTPLALGYLNKAIELAPDDSDLRLKLCMTQLSVGEMKAAHTNALLVLARQPGQEDAITVLVQSCLNTNEVQETIQQLEKLIREEKDRPGYHLGLGALYLRQGQFTNGVGEFHKALELGPNLPSVQTAIGNLYWLSNDIPRAEQALKAGAELSPQRSPRRLRYAEFKLKTGAVEEAKQLLQEIVKKAPDYVPAWNYLAQVAFAEGKFDDCEALVARILAKDPINLDAVLMDVNLKVKQDRVAKGIEQLQRLAKTYTGAPQIQLRLAQCYLLQGDNAKAEIALKEALRIDPNYADGIVALAELSLKKGDAASAAVSLEGLLKRRPDLPQAHLLLADAYFWQNNLDQAVAVYRRMQSLFPKSPQVPWLLARVLSRQNKRVEAREACTQSLQLAPDFVPPLEQLVDLDLADNQPDAALERVNKQIEERPSVPELQLLLAKIYLQQTNYTSAEETLRKTIQVAPDLRTSYILLAQLYNTSRRAPQALAELSALVARKTNDVQALMQIGMIQESLNNMAAARDAYEQLLKVNPNSGAALNNLAYLYSDFLGQLDKGAQLAERARALFPNDPSVADTLGWIRYHQGDYAKALPLITQAVNSLSEAPEVQCHLGLIRYALGQEDAARTALEQALKSTKDFPGKTEAAQRLAILQIDPKSADATSQAMLEKAVADAPKDGIALVLLGRVYERSGPLDRAIRAYEQSLAANPKNVFVLGRLANLYSAPGPLNDAKKALEYAKTAHLAAPDDLDTSRLLGHLACESGDYRWASSLLEEAAARSPDDPKILYDLARSYYGMGQLVPAADALRKLVKTNVAFDRLNEAKRFLAALDAYDDPAQRKTFAPEIDAILIQDPNYVPGLMVKATLQQEARDLAAAKKTLERVLAINPQFVPAIRDLVLICYESFPQESGSYDLAIKARQAYPNDARLAKALGVLCYRRQDFGGAVRFLSQSARTGKDDGEILFYLGMAQYRLNQKTESKQTLQRAIALNIPTNRVAEARQVLAEITRP